MAKANAKAKPAAGKAPSKAVKSTAGSAPQILVAHGVNLDLLGRREPDVYGRTTLAELEAELEAAAEGAARMAGLSNGCGLAFFQSNDETTFLERLGDGWDGILINPGAWTHTSLALADRLLGLGVPYVEVHLSNLAAREEFRQKSYSAAGAAGVVYGFGVDSYVVGLVGLLRALKR
jgi:3-dehydroquinate dehydratase-2